MYQERRKENWTQTIRRENLERVEKLISNAGGYSEVLHNMRDFERYVARELGCSIKTTKEYIDTVRGAAIFKGKSIDSGGEIDEDTRPNTIYISNSRTTRQTNRRSAE